MILHVGLTGGIASGKSTISRMFATLGCTTIDADAVVADLYRAGAPGHQALVRTYGPEILLPNGEVDRRKLADLSFASPGASRKLNALIHPLVLQVQERMLAAMGDRDGIVIVEATLLVEAGHLDRFDRIIVVDVAPEVQVARAVARGMSEEDVRRRIANQISRSERLRYADYVIDNSGPTAEAEAQTRRVYEQLQHDLEAKRRDASQA